VTGAARGIGAAVAREVTARGAGVALLDLDPAVHEVATEVRSGGAPVYSATCDLRFEDDVAREVRAAARELGGLDGVVNNAGVNAYFDAATMTLDQWDETFAVDLRAAWLVTKHALPHLIERAPSAIVNVSSIHARLTSPGMFPYGGAKAGLEGMTRSLALDYGPRDVRVNAVAPGFTRTRLVEEWLQQQPDPEQARADILARHPLGRMAEPADIACVIAFLLGEESRAITGAVIDADCGLGVRF
jgi:NAD(P)-dependent dehydrogenase (short-subunit alcohol dehydrogenase family)